MMLPYFYILLGITSALGAAFIFSVRGIYYHTPDTDNELMAYAAAQSYRWKWLSDVHKYSASTRKVSMKEWTVILISFFQKIFRDRTTDLPYTAMTGTAVCISTILIYLIAADYFNPAVAMIVAILYIISFWPWQVSLYGGHANMANMSFLFCIYCIQIGAGLAEVYPHLVLLFIGGIFLGLCLFSSPSSHKYFLAVFSALFFNGYRHFFGTQNIEGVINSLPFHNLMIIDITLIFILLAGYALMLSLYKPLTERIYYKKAGFLNSIITARDNFSVEHYIRHSKKKIYGFIYWSSRIALALLLLVNLIPSLMLAAFIAGSIFIFLAVNLPNIKENTIEYLTCMFEHKKKTHFKSYIDYFAKRGIIVRRNTRGAGLSWIPKILWLFIPFHMIIFLAMLSFGIYSALNTGDRTEALFIFVVGLISVSPIIWTEITKAPQASRLYSPSLITLLLLPAYILYSLPLTFGFQVIIFFLLSLIFFWNLWRFLDDVYPARMTVRNFMRIVDRLNIKDIYTYSTNFNAAFIDAVPGIGKAEYLPPKNIPPPFNVHYIRSLNEVKDGWIAIPGTSSKSLTAAGFNNMDEDYTDDPVLNRIIESKEIEKIATAKFKTYGTSRIWINEDDITSYRALHLKDIGPGDLYRGYAWLIHSSKLKNAIIQNESH